MMKIVKIKVKHSSEQIFLIKNDQTEHNRNQILSNENMKDELESNKNQTEHKNEQNNLLNIILSNNNLWNTNHISYF